MWNVLRNGKLGKVVGRLGISVNVFDRTLFCNSRMYRYRRFSQFSVFACFLFDNVWLRADILASNMFQLRNLGR